MLNKVLLKSCASVKYRNCFLSLPRRALSTKENDRRSHSDSTPEKTPSKKESGGEERKGQETTFINTWLDKIRGQSSSVSQASSADWLAENVPPPKHYATACTNHPLGKEYYDYENCELMFGPQDDYEFTGKLGRGRYSEVYRGVDLLHNEDVVVKILKPVRKVKVRREIDIL